MVNLLQIAPNGRYQSGQLTGEHAMPNPIDLPWNGPTNDNRGFVRPVSNALCEDSQRYNLLQMHPKWSPNGSIKGYLPAATMPTRAIFKSKVGFLNGANGTDGVRFQVWVHFIVGGRNVGYRVLNLHKKYTQKMIEVEADLSHLSGKQVRIELRVDAGAGSGRDWAVWADPRIETRSAGTNAKVFTIQPVRFKILDRNEETIVHGRGDEPYFGAIYFRSIFGRPGSTKVESFATLLTQGKNLKNGTYPFSADSRLGVTDVATIWNDTTQAFTNGIQISGYQMVAMEEDWHGKGKVREIIQDKEKLIFNALVKHVENRLAGALDMEGTAEAIKRDVSGDSSGFLKKHLVDFLAAISNADDLIGENGITLVNLSTTALQNQLGSEYNPGSLKNPVGAISPQTFTLEFKGSDARYQVEVVLSNAAWSQDLVN